MSEGGANGRVRVLVHSDSRVFSGAEWVLCEFVLGMAESDRLELTCMAPEENEELFATLSEAVGADSVRSVRSQPTRLGAVHLYDPRRLAHLRAELGEDRWDVAFVNLGSAEYGATPLALRDPPWRRSLGLVHVPSAFAPNGFRLGRMREAIARRPMRSLDAALVMTESAKETFEDVWAHEGLSVGLGPMPRRSLQPISRAEARSRFGWPIDAPVIGVAGRLSLKQKGFDTFVAAAGNLADRRPEVRFAIAGDGPDREELVGLIREAGMEDRVFLVGHIDEIEPFLCALDAIAIPSRFEGGPILALEAMQLGVPGVATDCEGLRDVWVGDWQIPVDDPGALSARLGDLLDLSPADRQSVIAEGRRLHDATVADRVGPDLEEKIVRLSRA
jgi:glycosyltransferase involved in cell wall biosynthesis